MEPGAFFRLGFIEFPLELLISESVFLFGRKPRGKLQFRLPLSVTAYFLTAAVWMNIIEAIPTESVIPYVFLYLGYAALTAIPVFICFDLKWLELLFVIAGGYATENMVFALMRIYLYMIYHTLETEGILRMFTSYGAYVLGALAMYVLVIRKNRYKNAFGQEDVRTVVFALILVISAIVLSVFYSYPTDEINYYNALICPSYSFICCVLIILIEYNVLHENHMKREQELMEQLLNMANIQQKSSREAIDIINIKCHDLKHQIKAFTKMDDEESRFQYVKEVQQAISIYDAAYHTGCEALDYVLREKVLLANEYKVVFSCMADGAQLQFMDTTDIYALFGNALDNALERVIQEKEEERTVSLHIRQRGEMTLIHLMNRCSRELEFQDGFPVTDKKDRRYHGFGVKSIRYITEKYGGEVYMKVLDGQFYLDILLPASKKN